MDDLEKPEVWDEDTGLVEVSLKIGEFNSLVLTTQLRVDWRDREQAVQTIRGVTQTLLRASPVAELKGLDHDYFNEFFEVGLDAKNNFAWLPKFSVEVKKKQDEIRKRLKPNGPGQPAGSSAPPRPQLD